MEWNEVPEGVTVHWAGDQITMNNRSRQRCLWCGALIEDKYWPDIQVPVVEGKSPEQVAAEMLLGAWGGYVGIDSDGLKFALQPGPNNEPPKGSCVYLPDEATA